MRNNSTCKTMSRAVIVRICLETILNEASVRSIESNSLRRNIVLEIKRWACTYVFNSFHVLKYL